MRILYHHRTLGDGAEGIHIKEMVRAFRALGHEVRVIGPMGEANPQSSTRSRVFSRVKQAIPPAMFELVEIGYSLFAFLKTTLEIRRFRPDFIYERYITFNAGTTFAGRFNRVPVLLEVNAPLALERSEQKDERLFFRRAAKAMERWTCSNSSRTIVVSTPLKDYLESIGVPKGKCFVMPNGADPERFRPAPRDPVMQGQLGFPADSLVVGFTGVLRPWHGLDFLLEAMRNVVAKGINVSLLIVGDGPYRTVVERLVSEYRLEGRVRITGRIAHDEVPRHVALFDVAVSPRATFYASPMKVLEYMALGKPVLVPRTQNFLDMIDEGVNGIAFEDGDVDGLAQAIGMLSASPEQCARLGQQARQKIENRLNWRWNALKSCELAERPAGSAIADSRAA